MLVRANPREREGKRHTSWLLVETVQTPDKPRQRIFWHLGDLNAAAQGRWLKTIEVFNEAGERHQLTVFPRGHPVTPGRERRRAGSGAARARRAVAPTGTVPGGLDSGAAVAPGPLPRNERVSGAGRRSVVASRRAARLQSALRAGESELAIEERWYQTTALDDLWHLPEGSINDSRLYRTLDHLLLHKPAFEHQLASRFGELSAAEFEVLLDDLTSSYVEGAAPKDPKLRAATAAIIGGDCEQVVLALILNVDGASLSHEKFDGGRSQT
jgi:hypothetical protein